MPECLSPPALKNSVKVSEEAHRVLGEEELKEAYKRWFFALCLLLFVLGIL